MLQGYHGNTVQVQQHHLTTEVDTRQNLWWDRSYHDAVAKQEGAVQGKKPSALLQTCSAHTHTHTHTEKKPLCLPYLLRAEEPL